MRSMSKRLMDKVEKYYDAENFEKAMGFINRLIEKDQNNAEAHFVKGNIHMAMEEPDMAIQSFDVAISLGYRDEIIYTNRGYANKKLGKLENAFSDYGSALKINKKFAPAYAIRGKLYLKVKDYINAIKDFDIALKIEPDDYHTLNNRCSAYAEIGNSTKALGDFNAFILSGNNDLPDMSEIETDRAHLYSKCGFHENAIQHYSKLIYDCPVLLTAYEWRAIEYEKLGEFEKAKADRDKIYEMKNNDGGYIEIFIVD